jgi:hypothetical protein
MLYRVGHGWDRYAHRVISVCQTLKNVAEDGITALACCIGARAGAAGGGSWVTVIIDAVPVSALAERCHRSVSGGRVDVSFQEGGVSCPGLGAR